MEKPSFQPKKVEGSHEDYHTTMKELLGSMYDEQTVDRCMALQSTNLKTIQEDLKNSLAKAKTEEEKNVIRQSWLDEHDYLSEKE